MLLILILLAVAFLLFAAAQARQRPAREAPADFQRALLLAVPDLVFVTNSDGECLEWHSPSVDDQAVRPKRAVRHLREVFPEDVERLLGMCVEEALQTPRTVVQEYSFDIGAERRHYEARMVRYGADRVVCLVRGQTAHETRPLPTILREKAPDAELVSIWEHDFRTEVLRVDPAVEQWLGTGKPVPSSFSAWLDQIHPSDRERFLASYPNSPPGAGPPEARGPVALLPDLEYRLIHEDGSIRRVRHCRQRISGADGSAARMVGTVAGIADSTRAEGSADQVRALLRRVVTAHEEERRRIGRELHDDLNQRVAELHMRSAVLSTHLQEEWPKFQDEASELFRTTTDLAAAVRNLARMLYPVVLDEAGLVPALQALAEQIRLEGVEVRVNASAESSEVSPAAALCLYRVAQEALRNVVRHARSPAADVSLTELDAMIELRVRDGGVGVDPQDTTLGGLGLTSMRERVTALGGTFELKSRPGEGTEVVACLPA